MYTTFIACFLETQAWDSSKEETMSLKYNPAYYRWELLEIVVTEFN